MLPCVSACARGPETSRLRARALEDEDEHMHAHGKRAVPPVRTVAAKEPHQKEDVGEGGEGGWRGAPARATAGLDQDGRVPRHETVSSAISGVEARMVGGTWYGTRQWTRWVGVGTPHNEPHRTLYWGFC